MFALLLLLLFAVSHPPNTSLAQHSMSVCSSSLRINDNPHDRNYIPSGLLKRRGIARCNIHQLKLCSYTLGVCIFLYVPCLAYLSLPSLLRQSRFTKNCFPLSRLNAPQRKSNVDGTNHPPAPQLPPESPALQTGVLRREQSLALSRTAGAHKHLGSS